MKTITKSVIVFLILLFSSITGAKEQSRPESKGGDYIVELVSGIVFEDDENVFELGIDFERFIEGTDHHFSVGVAAELEVTENDNEYYAGPLFSMYYFHIKTFFTSGILTDFKGQSEWKNRLGAGYEFIVKEHYLIVPTFAIDYIDGDFNASISLGLAHEF